MDVRIGDGLTAAQMLASAADLAIGTHRAASPYRSVLLADLPVWAYVPTTDPWRRHRSVDLEMLLTRPLIVVPVTFAAQAALDAALATHDFAHHTVVGAANGTISQALATTGRGVAVVSDDPRFEMHPVAIHIDGVPLRIRLYAACDPGSIAAQTAMLPPRLDLRPLQHGRPPRAHARKCRPGLHNAGRDRVGWRVGDTANSWPPSISACRHAVATFPINGTSSRSRTSRRSSRSFWLGAMMRKPAFASTSTRPMRTKSSIASRTGVADTPSWFASTGA
ncbi:LysR substrate-binding domain-containing protein [Phytohabitans kaempferiae]|uniref:LysR substrate-binding domain-containing protein n=1 Tax=Phytohabitans kaempferiae TaxID=1620943 RepID=A0ABV6M7M5_9ACTN